MACRMCDNARTNPRLTDNDDLSYFSVGDFAEKRRMMIRSGDGKPVEMLVEEHSEKSGWHLVGNYRPNFCPNCGRDLREDYVKRKRLCIFWNPGHGYQRCEQEKWRSCSCNGDVTKCERKPL